MSLTEISKQGQNIQQRWLNLRTCFSRELSAQKKITSGQPASKRRKYIYFEKLLFLLPTIEQRPTESNICPKENEVEENLDSEDISNLPPQPSQYRCTKRKKGNAKNSLEEEILKALSQEPDEDTNFALSLVPQLRSLPEDDKFDAKIQILSLLREIKRKNAGINSQPTSFPTETSGYHSTTIPTSVPSFGHPPVPNTAVDLQNISTIYCITSPSTSEDTIQSFVSNFAGDSSTSDIIDL